MRLVALAAGTAALGDADAEGAVEGVALARTDGAAAGTEVGAEGTDCALAGHAPTTKNITTQTTMKPQKAWRFGAGNASRAKRARG